MPATQFTAATFVPWNQVQDQNMVFALIATGAIAYDPEREIAVYYHHAMTGHEERPRFVVCPLQGEPLFSFLGTEREAPTLANIKYRAWLRRKQKVHQH